jgi:hypothetical protein
MLIDRGFVRVRPLLGGIDAWADAGFGLENLEQAVRRLESERKSTEGA